MKAVEINTITDKEGVLNLQFSLKEKQRKVRVIILIDEANDEDLETDDNQLVYSINSNTAFDFLKEPEEDIYTINDGEPLNDQSPSC